MTITQRFAKNATILLISQIITYVMVFFVTMYMARYLGILNFGIISLALSITAITGVISDLGLGSLTVRELSRDKTLTDKYFSNVFIIKIFLCLLTLLITFVIVKNLNYHDPTKIIIYIITISMLINTFNGIMNSIFQANQLMEFLAIGTVINSSILLIGTLIGMYFKLNVIYFALIYVIASLLTLIPTLIFYVKKFSLPELKIDLNFIKPILNKSLPFGIASVFVIVYYSIDSIMLSVMSGSEAVGFYNASYRILFIFLALFNVYITAIFPIMSNFYVTSRESLKFAFEKSFKYLLIISIPLTIGTILTANKVILLIYGESYLPSVLALQVLICTIIFMFLNGLISNLLSSTNRQRVVMTVTGFGAALNIILNLILIPKFSFIGASIATVITEFAILPLTLFIIIKAQETTIKPLIKDLPKIIIACVIMAISVLLFSFLNLFLIILIAIIVYLTSIILLKTLDEDDIKIIKNIFRKDSK